MYQESGALIEFYRDAVQNKNKSTKAGRAIFEDRDFVKIQTPGDTKTMIIRIATTQDKQRFPKSWNAYSRGLELPNEGTPLSEWNRCTRSQAKELKHVGIPTVEVLATVSDANIQRLGPGYRQLREQAKQFLVSADEQAATEAWAREKEAMAERIAQLEMAIETKKRGRPHKDVKVTE